VTTNIRNDIAELIQRVDGRNRLKPKTLAAEIEDGLQDLGVYTVEWKPLADLIARVNPDKTMGAAAMADAIVDEFNLDQEVCP
jgi:hypothetical protein